jgi:protein SCO1/2
VTLVRHSAVLLACLIVAASGCRREPAARQYELTGQVLAVDRERQEIVIRHEDIKGFMPGMTMPFRTKDPRWLEAATPGDIVTATLVVEAGDAWLSRVAPTGRREPLPADAPVPRVMDPPLRRGDAVPDATLVDDQGTPLVTSALRGVPWAVTFVYTRCPLPTFCPALDRQFQSVQRGIQGNGALAGARLLSVTIDPAYDRPPVLRAHAERLGADPRIWRFATGEVEAIDRFAGRFGLVVDRGAGKPEDLVHSLRTAVIDRQGRVVRIHEGADWKATDVLRDLREAAD